MFNISSNYGSIHGWIWTLSGIVLAWNQQKNWKPIKTINHVMIDNHDVMLVFVAQMQRRLNEPKAADGLPNDGFFNTFVNGMNIMFATIKQDKKRDL